MADNFKKRAAIAFVSGFIFSVGLAISGMTQPQKVIAFLDVLGNWDPSLAFVMGGAILVHLIAYRVIKERPHPVLDEKWYFPTSKELNLRLIGGALMFGIGWGMAGFCPGPALTSLGSTQWNSLVVVLSMTVGLLVYNQFFKPKKV